MMKMGNIQKFCKKRGRSGALCKMFTYICSVLTKRSVTIPFDDTRRKSGILIFSLIPQRFSCEIIYCAKMVIFASFVV